MQLIGQEKPSDEMCQLIEWRNVEVKEIDGLWFTIDHNAVCKHLIKKGNKFLCAIYDDRPQLCRDYPNGWSKSLLNEGCVYKEDE